MGIGQFIILFGMECACERHMRELTSISLVISNYFKMNANNKYKKELSKSIHDLSVFVKKPPPAHCAQKCKNKVRD
jgi:hypothetical protein